MRAPPEQVDYARYGVSPGEEFRLGADGRVVEVRPGGPRTRYLPKELRGTTTMTGA